MQWILRVFLEMILGYLLQIVAFVVGMHAMAKQKLETKKTVFTCVICAVLTFVVRECGLFNFGVHTMLMLLIINIACIVFCKMSIRPCILGSIVMMIFVLLTEVINFGILSIFFSQAEISTLLADPVYKAASAIPGNIVLLLLAILLYRIMKHRGKKNEPGKLAR